MIDLFIVHMRSWANLRSQTQCFDSPKRLNISLAAHFILNVCYLYGF